MCIYVNEICPLFSARHGVHRSHPARSGPPAAPPLGIVMDKCMYLLREAPEPAAASSYSYSCVATKADTNPLYSKQGLL